MEGRRGFDGGRSGVVDGRAIRGGKPSRVTSRPLHKFSLPDYHPCDDFTLGSAAARSAFPLVPDGGAAGFRRAIGRNGNLRHHASAANHALALDFGATGFPLNEYPEFGLHGRRGRSLQLVRYRPIPAHAACRYGLDLDGTLVPLFGLSTTTRQCAASWSATRTNILRKCPHGADRVPLAPPVALQRESNPSPGCSPCCSAPPICTTRRT